MRIAAIALFSMLLAGRAFADAPAANLTLEQIIEKVLDSDPWGLSGAQVSAHADLKDKQGSTSQLAFTAESLKYDPPLAKSLVRFSAPADMAGAGFLQIQNRGDNDDRYLFMPELKKSRRIAGNLRSSAFMGTDFSFGDLDRRDIRDSTGTIKADELIGKSLCYHLDVKPKRADSQYSHLALWVRKDNFMPVKSLMYDKSNVLLKTLTALELKRIKNQWFITRSRMVNHVENHTTELTLDVVTPRTDVPDSEFTVRVLEKL